MDCQNNSFKNLLESFKSVCSALETNAESDLHNMEKQCKEEFFESAKTVEKFNELTLGISETCKEVLNPSEILNILTKRADPESAIYVPYEIHSDLVNSVNAIYNMPLLEKGNFDEKLISERNKQLVNDLIEECEKNIFDMKDMQAAVVDAKATMNEPKYFF